MRSNINSDYKVYASAGRTTRSGTNSEHWTASSVQAGRLHDGPGDQSVPAPVLLRAELNSLVRYFGDYRLENVYLRTTEAQRAELFDLWRKGGLGPDYDRLERRADETVFLVRAPSGEVAGVSEVALVRARGGRRFYSYTTFIRERDRVPYLMLALLNASRDFLRTFEHPVSQPEGMLLVTENHKLMRPGMRKLLARNGYRYWGKTSWGDDVWGVEFAEPQRPGAPHFERVAVGVPRRALARSQPPPSGNIPLNSVPQT